MTEEKTTYPRRDAEGRIEHLPDLLGVALAGLVIGVLALVVFDAGFALMGLGEFGRANGWLAIILPAWIFVEEFRAWSYGPARIAAALVAAAVSITAGLLAAGLAEELPALASGSLAAGVFALVYSLIWFYGIRWLAHRVG
ncbi:MULTISPECIES: hypothetical protein [Polymorphospora]|uniref:DUF3054 domain-containing protein n=1 Tax=Polymorphospora lycopeni TaxID=3140240 RepID=A0ABV5CN04_9ACTN